MSLPDSLPGCCLRLPMRKLPSFALSGPRPDLVRFHSDLPGETSRRVDRCTAAGDARCLKSAFLAHKSKPASQSGGNLLVCHLEPPFSFSPICEQDRDSKSGRRARRNAMSEADPQNDADRVSSNRRRRGPGDPVLGLRRNPSDPPEAPREAAGCSICCCCRRCCCKIILPSFLDRTKACFVRCLYISASTIVKYGYQAKWICSSSEWYTESRHLCVKYSQGFNLYHSNRPASRYIRHSRSSIDICDVKRTLYTLSELVLRDCVPHFPDHPIAGSSRIEQLGNHVSVQSEARAVRRERDRQQ